MCAHIAKKGFSTQRGLGFFHGSFFSFLTIPFCLHTMYSSPFSFVGAEAVAAAAAPGDKEEEDEEDEELEVEDVMRCWLLEVEDWKE